MLQNVGQQILQNMIRNIVMGEARYIAAEQAKAAASGAAGDARLLPHAMRSNKAHQSRRTGRAESRRCGVCALPYSPASSSLA